MAYIRQIAESDATGPLAAVYEAAVKRAGRIANIIRVMSRDGASAAASMQFYVSLMKSPTGLSPARREMLAAVVSNVNECYY
jgi:alkylhydroperoxidase family enzyme